MIDNHKNKDNDNKFLDLFSCLWTDAVIDGMLTLININDLDQQFYLLLEFHISVMHLRNTSFRCYYIFHLVRHFPKRFPSRFDKA